MLLLWFIIPVFTAYSLLVLYYWKSWLAIPEFEMNEPVTGIRFSVIVPARNEELFIGRLLDALAKQTYPKDMFEVIVIDDHSEDSTATVVRSHSGVKLVRLEQEGINSYKKKAIEVGIATAAHDWIVTTDADCVPPQNWLSTIAGFQSKTNAGFIAAPVIINNGNKLVELFQAMDFMVLQGITGAVVAGKQQSMCNGANLVYEKKLFIEAGGFSGIDHIASGDDMLLMHKIQKLHPDRVFYLKSKEALVSTEPVHNWKSFFQQRIRWASKATKYDDPKILPVLAIVYLANLSFAILVFAGFFDARYWFAGLFLWVLKTIVEFPLFNSLCNFFNAYSYKKWFFLFQPLHIAYTIVAGLFGQFGSYEWKGRTVR